MNVKEVRVELREHRLQPIATVSVRVRGRYYQITPAETLWDPHSGRRGIAFVADDSIDREKT